MKNNKNSPSKFSIVEEFISKKYDIRYNVISNQFEFKEKKEQIFIELNENNIFRELQLNHINISMSNLIAILKSDFTKKFNPFTDYFNKLENWDGIDYIKTLSNYIKVNECDKNRFQTQFKKALIRTIACCLEIDWNKQAFILVHKKQNSGKTTFIRWLCPPELQNYYVENINGTDKDSEIALAENFIINLDELSTLSKADINALKSFMSKDTIKRRLPFDKRPSILKRRCSFWGSTNRSEFLSDETGNVRWICFEIESIDWDYKKDIDINKIWSQAYYLFKTGEKYKFSPEEVIENDIANKKFMQLSQEMELLSTFYIPANENDDCAVFMQPTELISKLNEETKYQFKLSNVAMGKALNFFGFEKVAKYDNVRKFNIYGYWLKHRGFINDFSNRECDSSHLDIELQPIECNELPF